MQMYPSYRLRDVLDEYAITFFSLLNEGYRQRFKHYDMLGRLADLPYMNKEQRFQFYKSLEWASTHPSDILKTSGKGADDDQIEKLLKG